MGIQNEQWARIEIFSHNLMTKHLTSLFNSKFKKCEMEKTKYLPTTHGQTPCFSNCLFSTLPRFE